MVGHDAMVMEARAYSLAPITVCHFLTQGRHSTRRIDKERASNGSQDTQPVGTVSGDMCLLRLAHQDIDQEAQHIMSSVSQFFSIIHTAIRSFGTAISTYIHSHRRSPVKMTYLEGHCHYYPRHQYVVNDSSSNNTRLQTPYDPYYIHDTLERHTPPHDLSLSNHDGSTDLPFAAAPGRTSFPRPPGPLPATSSPSHDSSIYLCTFCWRPHAAAATPSRVVGHRARLACEVCYNALLDLAVCWVCGEVVRRGDECVSLGWCFWHQGCYGCLMCGDKRVVEGTPLGDLFQEEDGGGAGAGANHAKEVDDVPLCAKCVAEVTSDPEALLIPMALDRVERFDGGLSRRRWEARHAGAATCGVVTRPQEEAAGRAPSPIYVSMHDPLGQPAFRRSATKPIPSWMQYLPSSQRRQQDDNNNNPIITVANNNNTEPRPASLLLDDDDDDYDYFSPSEPSSSSINAGASLDFKLAEHSDLPLPEYNNNTPSVQMSRSFTLIAEEPVQRPSSSRGRPAQARLPPSAPGGRSKHVRFRGNGPSSSSAFPTTAGDDDAGMAGTAATKIPGKSPSESSEFLEKYYHHHHHPRHRRPASAVGGPPSEEVVADSSSSYSSTSPWPRPHSHHPAGTTRVNSRYLQQIGSPAAPDRGGGGPPRWSSQIRGRVDARHTVYNNNTPPRGGDVGGGGARRFDMSSRGAHGGGDGVSDFVVVLGGGGGFWGGTAAADKGLEGRSSQSSSRSTPTGGTFQDQLKRMFGFV